MGRRFFFGFIFVIMIGLLYAGCSNDGNPANPEVQTKTITAISGKLENWSLGSGKTISLVYGGAGFLTSFGVSDISDDGSFNIELSAPDSSLLESGRGFVDGSCDKDITVSDTSAMYVLGMLVISDNNKVIGFAQHGGGAGQTQTDTVGSFTINYYYFDRNVDISGIQLCGSKERYDYELNFEKGWNRVTGSLTENTPSSVKYEYKTNVPDGSKFIFRNL